MEQQQQQNLTSSRQAMYFFLLASIFGLFMFFGETVLVLMLGGGGVPGTGAIVRLIEIGFGFYPYYLVSFAFIITGVCGFFHYRKKAVIQENSYLEKWR